MPVDWKQIHEHLDTVRMILESQSMRTPEEIRKLLKSRAQQYAREPENLEQNGEIIAVLDFRLASENYAIELSYIKEVIPLKTFVTLAGTPPFVLGIANLRGQVYSVIDIKKFFGLPDKGLGDLNKVIIIQYGGIEFGILADTITGVRTVLHRELQSAIPTLTGIRQEYLMGVSPDQLIVLDAGKILSDKTLVIDK